jgi:FkbM family methyltransferase
MFIHELKDIPVGSTICIYGTGSRGILLKKYLESKRNDITVKCFLDSYKDNEVIDGVPVFNIDSFEKAKFDYDIIVLASSYWQEILADLNTRNISKAKILGLHFATCLASLEDADKYSCDYFAENPDGYEKFKDKVLELFEQQEDKELFQKIYDIRKGKYPHSSLEQNQRFEEVLHQYLHYINKDAIGTIIDGGVYDGAGLDMFLHHLSSVQKIYGFEPLKDLYCNSLPLVLDGDELSKIEVLPMALSDKKSTMNIAVNLHGSTLTEAETQDSIAVETISIDEFVQEKGISKVDFIKLDVENAEMSVLQGAMNTINKHRPQMAISIYHSTNQFFGIPLFLADNLNDYTYRIKHYSMNLADTVLYAIPNEKL